MRDTGTKKRKPTRLTGLAALALALSLIAGTVTGCAPRQEEPDDGRMKVVTTIFPPYDFARAISGNGELAYVRMLLSPGEEIHSYEPTPLDIKEIQNCDLFIYTGGENDVWVDRILENMGEKRPQTLRLVDLTDTVEEEITEGMMQERGHDHDHEEAEEHDHEAESGHDHETEGEHDHEDSEHANGGDSSHEEHEEADEHVWTSPVKAAEITAAIAEKMAEIDPANAEAYLANAGAYEEQILSVDAQFREIVQNAKRRTIVFGDRFPVRYFAEEYGLEYYAAFPGCSSESEPSASTICESTGAVPRTFYSCHNVTKRQMEDGATYVSMMSENLDVIREALGGEK